jgi:predicted dehydrogenase
MLVQALGTIGPTGVDEEAAFHMQYSRGVIGSFFVSIRAWAPDQFQVLGTEGMLGLQGSIVRPFGLSLSRQAPVMAERPQFGWRARARQHGLVHQIAQLTGRSSRTRGREIMHRYSGNGYHYEAEEVRACIARGAIESTIMPLNDSIAVAKTADMIRNEIRSHGMARLGLP